MRALGTTMWPPLCVLWLAAAAASSVTDMAFIQGPGLRPHSNRLPCHYFFVHLRQVGLQPGLDVRISGQLLSGQLVQIKPQILVSQPDSLLIVRYKLYRSFSEMNMSVTLNGSHVGGSPVLVQHVVNPSSCDCPQHDFDTWLRDFGCQEDVDQELYQQIDSDLEPFPGPVDMAAAVEVARSSFHATSSSFCHYAIVQNDVFSRCFGQYVDFKMFVDAILLYLTKVVRLPDTEFLINLGDWPLVRKRGHLIPMISWCKTDQHADLLWPTYEVTQAALECMGRQLMDMLSVQHEAQRCGPWPSKNPKALFRGRDSRQERLHLAAMGKNHSDVLDVGITNYFFFREQEADLGRVPRLSFFDFFKYKYQLSVDGTVAAYRLPFLLAGNSVVLKQQSLYKEHFYSLLKPYEHYIPVKSDLSDLVQQIKWAELHDAEAQRISANAQALVNRHLLPHSIVCYHAVFLKKWSARLSAVGLGPGMTRVNGDESTLSWDCSCSGAHDEL